MKLTGYLKLEKPEGSDIARPEPFNNNFDKLDKELSDINKSSEKWNQATEGIILLENITINKANWLEDKGNYLYKIKSNKSSIEHFPIFAPHRDYVEKSKLIYSIEAKNKEIVLYSKLPPLNDLKINITLLKGVF